MKRIALTLGLLFAFILSYGQDVLITQPNDNIRCSYETENAEILNAQRRTRFHLLYSPFIPFGENPVVPVGLKIGVGGRWAGGYISGGYKFEYKELDYLAIGYLMRPVPMRNYYFGGSISLNGWDGYINMEGGVIFNIHFLSFEAGLGMSIFTLHPGYYGPSYTDFSPAENVYVKLGIGLNF